MDPAEARRRLAGARLGRLATVDAEGQPHVVPICFAPTAGVETIYSAVDEKPKRTHDLRRLANVAANPRVAVLVDHYEEDWAELWWVRADGRGRLVAAGGAEHGRATGLLRARYRQYEDYALAGVVLAIDVVRLSGWRAAA
jgi:PPOX class probable F420-dependent enzyme